MRKQNWQGPCESEEFNGPRCPRRCYRCTPQEVRDQEADTLATKKRHQNIRAAERKKRNAQFAKYEASR